MRAHLAVFLSLSMIGCGGGGDDDDVPTPVTLAFTEPAAGATLVRDMLEPTDGWVAAPLAVQLAITGEVATVEVTADDRALGAADATGALDGYLTELGTTTLTATAKDAAGATLATATIDVMVDDPELASCRAWLDHYGVAYTVGPANQGVADPVTVTTPINGMVYRYLGNSAPRARFFMDCSLARSLVRAAPHWRSRGVVEVQDIGVYNYRCIGSGTPPDCPSGMSQHAYAKAIDLARFVHADDTTYTVETDWVIDPSTEPTCAATTEDAKDDWLHKLICALKGDDVWNIVLTPNYNSAHRDHFHVDLTTGSDFIRGRAPMDHGPDDD
ncbi:MAG: extensin family protein [Myxococcales bacterium]|nr:extensin family protein [Myxococcales bacterium]